MPKAVKVVSKKKSISFDINPYPGLRPYEQKDHPFFFGREKNINELARLLRQNRFLSIIGSSGSGKSSLIKAGLIPRLQKGLMTNDEAFWNICVFRPEGNPMNSLINSLIDLKTKEIAALNEIRVSKEEINQLDNDISIDQKEYSKSKKHKTQNLEFSVKEKKQLSKLLRIDSNGLLSAFNYLGLKGKLLIVVDQFEEIFRYKENNQPASESTKAFVDRLIRIASLQEDIDKAKAEYEGFENAEELIAKELSIPEVYVCITMRSDFMGDCSAFLDLPEAIAKGIYLVPRLKRTQLKNAIQKPAELSRTRIHPKLLNRLVNELDEEQDQLPILQHALHVTYSHWKKRVGKVDDPSNEKNWISTYDYTAIGTMTEALDQHANNILTTLKNENEKYLTYTRRIFKFITQSDGGRGIRRPQTLQAIHKATNISYKDLKKIINRFRDVDNSFLMPPGKRPLTKNDTIDISHESLMRIWKKMDRWVVEEQENGKLFKKLHNAYKNNYLVKKNKYERFPLSYSDRRSIRKFIKKRPLTEGWAKRYGGDAEKCQIYLNKHRFYSFRKSWGNWILLGLAFIGFIIYNINKESLDSKIRKEKLYAFGDLVLASNYLKDSETKKSFNLVKQVKETIKTHKGKRIDIDKIKFVSQQSLERQCNDVYFQAFNSGPFYNNIIPNVKFYSFHKNKPLLFTVDYENKINILNSNDTKEIQDSFQTSIPREYDPIEYVESKNGKMSMLTFSNGKEKILQIFSEGVFDNLEKSKSDSLNRFQNIELNIDLLTSQKILERKILDSLIRNEIIKDSDFKNSEFEKVYFHSEKINSDNVPLGSTILNSSFSNDSSINIIYLIDSNEKVCYTIPTKKKSDFRKRLYKNLLLDEKQNAIYDNISNAQFFLNNNFLLVESKSLRPRLYRIQDGIPEINLPDYKGENKKYKITITESPDSKNLFLKLDEKHFKVISSQGETSITFKMKKEIKDERFLDNQFVIFSQGNKTKKVSLEKIISEKNLKKLKIEDFIPSKSSKYKSILFEDAIWKNLSQSGVSLDFNSLWTTQLINDSILIAGTIDSNLIIWNHSNYPINIYRNIARNKVEKLIDFEINDDTLKIFSKYKTTYWKGDSLLNEINPLGKPVKTSYERFLQKNKIIKSDSKITIGSDKDSISIEDGKIKTLIPSQFSSDNQKFIYTNANGKIFEYNLANNQSNSIKVENNNMEFAYIAFSKTRNLLAAIEGYDLHIFKKEEKNKDFDYTPYFSIPLKFYSKKIAFSSNGKYIYCLTDKFVQKICVTQDEIERLLNDKNIYGNYKIE